ncbi:MAG: hypothetical protein COB50_00905 [Thiotrichales bacterium]|nr:MAG: hypothetical protein COB50_00905 [Thiotrichales bacterium]
MAIFRTNFEVIPASEEEIIIYYETAAKKINALLARYVICNSKGDLEKVSADQFRALLSISDFFQSTPLKTIFFKQKQQFVPQEILHVFRSIVSNPPTNIKAVLCNKFINLLMQKKWDKSLSAYFEKQYNFPSDGTIVLSDLQDFSFGSGVYRATFRLMSSSMEEVTVFLKGSSEIQSGNEILYFNLQKQFLSTARYAKMPCILSNEENKAELLLSPVITGVASDTTLSKLIYANQETKDDDHKFILEKAIAFIIEAFICHAALGDILGRNDRHLRNSRIAFVTDSTPEVNMAENLNNPEKILSYAKTIITNETKAFSLIDFDLVWLLVRGNYRWIFVDIDFGLSELNLMSLLDEFNDYNSEKNPFYEKRKQYVARYFAVYCQKQADILQNKKVIFAAIKKSYVPEIAEEKWKLLTQEITLAEKSKEPVIKLFKRYLLNFRLRKVYKETLLALHAIAIQLNNVHLLTAITKAKLLKYIPPKSAFTSSAPDVFLQLQCFRGVLAKQDMEILCKNPRTTWEMVASNIAMITKKFDNKLFKSLQDKTQFIKNDTAELLGGLQNTETKEAKDEYAKPKTLVQAFQLFSNQAVFLQSPTTPSSGEKKIQTNSSVITETGYEIST